MKYKRESGKIWERAVMQTQDKGESVHNFLEFFQPSVCLYQAMQVQKKKFSIAHTYHHQTYTVIQLFCFSNKDIYSFTSFKYFF